MKSISTTVFCLLIVGFTFSQRNANVTSANTSNFSVSNSKSSSHSSSNVSNSNSNYSVGNSYSSTNDNSNSSNYNSNSYSNNNSSNSSTNSNSNWSNNNNSNSNSNYNNNSYNNNGYNSYNNSNYNTYDSKQSYTTRDENYGQRTISEDQGKLIPKSNPYNIANMFNNYRNNTPIQKFFKQNQKPSQIFIINAQEENTIHGTSGTIVKIAPNSFLDKNGEVVKGDVEFEMKEMYTKSDMIFSNAHTVSNDQVLKSGGEVFLGSSRNGEPLILANDKPISVEFPAVGKEPMQLFNGQPNGNTVNWNAVSSNEFIPVASNNSSTGFSYTFASSNMNWLNCDQFPSRGLNNSNDVVYINTTKVKVHLDDRHDSSNTAIFIVYKGQNSVTKFDCFTRYDASNKLLRQNSFNTKFYSVQEGAEVTIVAISEINGQYYSTMDRTTIQTNHTANLALQPTTLEQIKLDMENLQ